MKKVFDNLVAYQLSRRVGLADSVRLANDYMDGTDRYHEAIKKMPAGLVPLFDELIMQRLRDGYDLGSATQYAIEMMPESEFESYTEAIKAFDPPAPEKKAAAK